MKTYLASLLRHSFTSLAGLGGFLVSYNLLDQGDVAGVDAAGVSLGTAVATILTAVLGRLFITVTGKFFTGASGESNGASGVASLLVLVGMSAVVMGCLPACSTAQLDAAKTIPVHTTLHTDYGTASYDSQIGLDLEVDATSGK